MSFLFLLKDLKMLRAKRELVNTLYREAGQDVGEAAQQGETTHDNAPYDQAMHEMNLKGQQLSEIDAMLREAQVVPMPTTVDTIAIGHKVGVLDIAAMHTTWYVLGSYKTEIDLSNTSTEENGTKEHPYTASYFSPIGCSINGKVLNQDFDLKLPNSSKPRRMRVVEIEIAN